MKRKELIFVNVLLVGLAVLFGGLAFSLTVNKGPLGDSKVQLATIASAKKADDTKCSRTPSLKISAGNDQELGRLTDYQRICNSFVTNKLMIFTSFSQDASAGDSDATAMASKLKLFKQANVTPLVMVEPYITGGAMSYKAYLDGVYDKGMVEYFKQLKAAGITDDMMGVWVPFPESNVPGWNNIDTEPHDFSLVVNKYLTLLKQYFPGAKGSILLSATTYEPDDINWENGDYVGLSQYVGGLDRNLVTSVGIEGFPWISNAKQAKHTIFDPAEFLQPGLAIQMAQELHTRDIWINSGTFGSKYTTDPKKTVHMSVNERKTILDGILQVAVGMRDSQQNQYRVSINLFSEDKSATPEATDWSYFQDADNESILKTFLIDATKSGIPISISDKRK